ELKAFPFLHRSPSQSLSPSFLALLFTSLFGLCSLQQDLGQPRSVFLGLNLVWRRRKPLPFRDGLPSRQSARSVPPSARICLCERRSSEPYRLFGLLTRPADRFLCN